MSALSSGLILGGAKEVFIYTGTLNFNLVNNFLLFKLTESSFSLELLPIKVGIVFILFGFLFKISAAPSHFWAPEVYEGTPYSLVTFILLPIKVAAGSVLLRILKGVFNIFGINESLNYTLNNELEFLIILIIVLSMLIGAINSLFEQKLKRFLAYSSINQIGFLLVGLLGLNSSYYGIQAFFYFLLTYVLNMCIFFGIILFILNLHKKIRFFYTAVSTNTYILEYISDFRKIPAFNKNYGWLSVLLALTMFSLAGIPPLAGFFGKFYILLYAFYLEN